jgi:beta-glucosidase
MIKQKLIYSIFLLIFLMACKTKQTFVFPHQNPKLSLEARVDSLVAMMTLDEKISQMVNNAAAIERLNVPAYNWWNEALHGVARTPYHVTSYPQAIGLAATWNPDALRAMGDNCATEGRAIYNDAQKKGKTGIYLGLTYWSPNVNIFRDPRWGRGQETYGEDPYLTSTLGMAFVNGLQGNHPTYLKASACAKHYAVHSGPEWNRSTFNATVSPYDLYDTYLPAFKALVVDAKVSGVMPAYNALDGQPCCVNDQLMNDILRDKWKFKGYVTSDCGAIGHLWRTHKTHKTHESAAADAVLHTTDCECSARPTYFALKKAVEDGLIAEAAITASVKRLFTVRFRLGMFDPPQNVPFSRLGLDQLEAPAHQALALKMARESMVLLKNEDRLLPLKKDLSSIAIVGPNADDKSVLLGNYFGYPTKINSVLDAFKTKTSASILYEKGCNLTDTKVFHPIVHKDLLSIDGTLGFRAEYFQNINHEGKPLAIKQVKKIDFQWGDGEYIVDKIVANNASIRFTSMFKADKAGDYTFELRGDNKAKLFIDDSLKIETDLKSANFTLKAEAGRAYKVVVDYVQLADNAEVKLDLGYIKNEDPTAVAQRVSKADVIVFVGGISAKLEGEAMPVDIEGFKGGDRLHIGLPTVQTDLLKALHATGKKVIFLNMSGSAMGFEWEAQNLPAIIQAWYGGQAGGDALVDIVFGDYNPSGKLPITFYKNVNDLPDFEDYSMANRTYRYYKGNPLYSFGFGLSYTQFHYSNLGIKKRNQDQLEVTVEVANTGMMAGDEVVQLYISSESQGSALSPIRALKKFKRIFIPPRKKEKITFVLDQKDLSKIDALGNSIPLTGAIEIAVGGGQPLPSTKDRIHFVTSSFRL